MSRDTESLLRLLKSLCGYLCILSFVEWESYLVLIDRANHECSHKGHLVAWPTFIEQSQAQPESGDIWLPKLVGALLSFSGSQR